MVLIAFFSSKFNILIWKECISKLKPADQDPLFFTYTMIPFFNIITIDLKAGFYQIPLNPY